MRINFKNPIAILLLVASCGQPKTTNEPTNHEIAATPQDADEQSHLTLSGDIIKGACRYTLSPTKVFTNAPDYPNSNHRTTGVQFCNGGVNPYALPAEAHTSAEKCKEAVKKIYSYCNTDYSRKYEDDNGGPGAGYAYYKDGKVAEQGTVAKPDRINAIYGKTSCNIQINDCPNAPHLANQLIREPYLIFTGGSEISVRAMYLPSYFNRFRDGSSYDSCPRRARYYQTLCASEVRPYAENDNQLSADYSEGCGSTSRVNAPSYRSARGGCQFKDAFVIGEENPRYYNKIWQEAGFTGLFKTEFDGVYPAQYFAATPSIKIPAPIKNPMHPDLRYVDLLFSYGKGVSVSEAEEFCKNSRSGGYDTWRLPTIAELKLRSRSEDYLYNLDSSTVLTSDKRQLYYKDCKGNVQKGDFRNVLSKLNGDSSEDIDGDSIKAAQLGCFDRLNKGFKTKAVDRCRFRNQDPRVCFLEDYAQQSVYSKYKTDGGARCIRSIGGQPKFADLKFSFVPQDETIQAAAAHYKVQRGAASKFHLKAFNAGVADGTITGVLVGYTKKNTKVSFDYKQIESRKVGANRTELMPFSIAVEKSPDPKVLEDFDVLYFQIHYQLGDGIARTQSLAVQLTTTNPPELAQLPDSKILPDFDILRMDGTPIYDGMEINFPALEPKAWFTYLDLQVKRKTTSLVYLSSKVIGNKPEHLDQMPEGLINRTGPAGRNYFAPNDPIWHQHGFRNIGLDSPWSGTIVLKVTSNSMKEESRVMYLKLNFGKDLKTP